MDSIQIKKMWDRGYAKGRYDKIHKLQAIYEEQDETNNVYAKGYISGFYGKQRQRSPAINEAGK